MGIRHLNKYLKHNCSQSINCVSLSSLANKKIAVDVSIYMYKYLADNVLIENFYLMMGIFKQNSITPVFIFDGKPPVEKNDMLKERRKTRMRLEKEYNVLKEQLNGLNDDDNKNELMKELLVLKKKIVYITKQNISDIKTLITAYGFSYYDAEEEADEICVKLVLTNQVWGCMSEDMDMFMYGCPFVIRYLNLIQGTVVVYNTYSILNDINIDIDNFRLICALSGTDYNINNELTLFDALNLFEKYNKENRDLITKISFYDWLKSYYHPNIIDDNINNIIEMFSLQKKCYIENINICDGPIIRKDMREILEKDGFVFAH